jgi:hypothetical protein
MLMEVQQYSIGRDSIPRGRMAKMLEARDRFICEGVLEEGYLASELADFLGCYPSNVSRGAESIGELIELGKSDPKVPLIVVTLVIVGLAYFGLFPNSFCASLRIERSAISLSEISRSTLAVFFASSTISRRPASGSAPSSLKTRAALS